MTPDDYDRQIEAARRRLDPLMRAVTIAEVARRTGIARPSLSQWLAGTRELPVRQVAGIARAVGARLDLRVRGGG